MTVIGFQGKSTGGVGGWVELYPVFFRIFYFANIIPTTNMVDIMRYISCKCVAKYMMIRMKAAANVARGHSQLCATKMY